MEYLKNSRILKIILAICIISISAQMTIDVSDIPITGQTLSVLILALLYKPMDIAIITISYVLLGIIGVPIFAHGASGIDKVTGGSGGFLIGFIISSVTISYIFESLKSKGWITIFLLTTLGTALILCFGVGRLAMLHGIEKGIEYGFTPFWQGALVKIFLGTMFVWVLRILIKEVWV